MSNHNIKSLRDLLARARTLKQLTMEGRQLEQLNHRFLTRLPSMLAQYCHLKSYRNGRLIVESHSATVATQLRFTTPQLMDQLRKVPEFSALQSLDIKVKTPTASPSKPVRTARRRAPVSEETTSLIRDTAASLSSPELGESLRRLAHTLDQLKR